MNLAEIKDTMLSVRDVGLGTILILYGVMYLTGDLQKNGVPVLEHTKTSTPSLSSTELVLKVSGDGDQEELGHVALFAGRRKGVGLELGMGETDWQIKLGKSGHFIIEKNTDK